MTKLLFLVAEDWYFCSHRLPLARAAVAAGYEVVVATRLNEARHRQAIEAIGGRVIPLGLRRGSHNPWQELRAINEIRAIYRRERPDIVHQVALKPVLYGSLAARLSARPVVVNALAGLGYIFTSSAGKARLLQPLVAAALRWLLNGPRSHLILQNPDDQQLLVQRGIVQADRVCQVRGSGVDIQRFAVSAQPEGVPLVILPARLLWDKGVGEFVAAARQLRQAGVVARFALVGATDEENSAAITEEQLLGWQHEGVVERWGLCDDMPAVLAQASIVCLPSYREGLPKALLEAAACGRAMVATDVPGCREIVIHEHNGLLVPARDPLSLAAALQRLLQDGALRERLGENGRRLVEAEFSDEKVIQQTLALYAQALQ